MVEPNKLVLVPEFIGYYTTLGPTGYVEANTKELVEEAARCMLERHSNARRGVTHHSWRSGKYWITIWTRQEANGARS